MGNGGSQKIASLPLTLSLSKGCLSFYPPGMSFYAYMLHCRGGYFYVGHTDDLDLRMAQHASGHFPGFTRDHLPVKLVWCQDFPTRYEAISAERQIKGWSRAKKMALVRGDWEKISALARGKGRASTSSA
jgi:predicted GIY-YIG superfamily endonuclease